MERLIPRVKRARYILIPTSERTGAMARTPRRRYGRSTSGRSSRRSTTPREGHGRRAGLRSLTLTAEHVKAFAQLTATTNPLHFDRQFVARTKFGKLVVQGGLTTGLLHALVAMDLPGPGTVFLSQNWKFTAPVYIGDTITAEAEIVSVHESKPVCQLKIRVARANGRRKNVLEGEAWLLHVRKRDRDYLGASEARRDLLREPTRQTRRGDGTWVPSPEHRARSQRPYRLSVHFNGRLSVCGPEAARRLVRAVPTQSAGPVRRNRPEVIRITALCSFSQTRIPVLCGLSVGVPGILASSRFENQRGRSISTTSYAVDALDFARSISSPCENVRLALRAQWHANREDRERGGEETADSPSTCPLLPMV